MLDDYAVRAYEIQAVYVQQRFPPAKVKVFIDYLKAIYNFAGYRERGLAEVAP